MAEAAYDTNNIFAKILRGEIPSHRVYEDDAVVAFMDVMPQGPGHTLVVPKAPSRNLLDADPATLGPLFTVVQKVAQAVKTRLSAPTASPSCSSTNRRRARPSITSMSMSSRVSRASL